MTNMSYDSGGIRISEAYYWHYELKVCYRGVYKKVFRCVAPVTSVILVVNKRSDS